VAVTSVPTAPDPVAPLPVAPHPVAPAPVAPDPVAPAPAPEVAAPAADHVGGQQAPATEPRRPDFVDVPLPGMPEVAGDRPARITGQGPRVAPGPAGAEPAAPRR
jgi:hypothetical protein